MRKEALAARWAKLASRRAEVGDAPVWRELSIKESGMKEFESMVKTAAKVLFVGAAAVAGFKYGHDFLEWRNTMMEAGSMMSYWIPVIPEGKMLLDSVGLGVASAGLGLVGMVKAEDMLDKLKGKRSRHAGPVCGKTPKV